MGVEEMEKEKIKLQGKINALRNEINRKKFIISNAENPQKIEDAEKAIPKLETELSKLYEELRKKFIVF